MWLATPVAVATECQAATKKPPAGGCWRWVRRAHPGGASTRIWSPQALAAQPHRKAHNVAVQITAPNGLNDKSKTEDDRKRVLEQLIRLGVLSEF